MASGELRSIGSLFGLLGALLLVLAGVVDFVGGFVFLALGYGGHALGAWDRSVVYIVIGLLFGFFAVVGRSGPNDRRVGAGAVLVVLALVGWLVLGFGGELLALLGTLFALLAGVLYLVSGR